jgi:acetylornithine deacetylase/succinyl-diaminopimelate desuccinylase-like protein
MCAVEFEVSTLDHAVHSGMYGGLAPDAMLAMTKVLASLHDEQRLGRGAPDCTASSKPTSTTTRRPCAGIRECSSPPSSSAQAPGLPAVDAAVDHRHRPRHPRCGGLSNTLQSSLKAKLSIRLAPGDTPASAVRAVEDHLRANLPFGAQLSIGETEGGSPWQADENDPVVRTARQAFTDAWGTESVTMGIGGSIPFIADLLEVFPARRSSSRVSKTPTPGPTAPTNRCTCPISRPRSSPKHCCCSASATKDDANGE